MKEFNGKKNSQTKELRKLIEPVKSIHELTKNHPDSSYLLTDIMAVLKGKDVGRLLTTNEQLDLFRLLGVLQWTV